MATNGANGIVNGLGSGATKLRRMIEDPNGFVAAPGVHDGLSARTTLEVGGWDCLYMVSLALSPIDPIAVQLKANRRFLTNRPAPALQPPASAPQTWA
jgi:hypothetical protein